MVTLLPKELKSVTSKNGWKPFPTLRKILMKRNKLPLVTCSRPRPSSEFMQLNFYLNSRPRRSSLFMQLNSFLQNDGLTNGQLIHRKTLALNQKISFLKSSHPIVIQYNSYQRHLSEGLNTSYQIPLS